MLSLEKERLERRPGKFDLNQHNLVSYHCEDMYLLLSYVLLRPVSETDFTGHVKAGLSKIR